MRTFVSWSLLLAVLAWLPPAHADGRWLDDTLIASYLPGSDRVALDVKEDNSAWFALASGTDIDEQSYWFRSDNAGATWTFLWGHPWVVEDPAYSGAYGFGRILNVWQPYYTLWYETIDAVSGALVSSGTFIHEAPFKAREIVVDSNAESGPAQVFIACALLADDATGEVVLKAYRTLDLGLTWTDFAVLDQGPPGAPDYIGDIDLSFSVAGYPYFHVIYEKNGRLWHVRTSDAGATWDAPNELIVNVTPTTQVGVAAHGIYALAVGESPAGQVVYSYSQDAGASWGPASLIDAAEPTPRLPSVCKNFGAWTVLYRKGDGRLAVRTNTNPNMAANWSAETYATQGTTARPIATAMSGYPDGNVGVVYLRASDEDRPYFASAHGEPGGVGDEPLEFATGPLMAYPNPARGPIKVLQPGRRGDLAAGQQLIFVTDPAGRIVVRLDGAGGAGISPVRWDGRDAAGRLVGSGTYYIHLSTPEGTRTAPVVVLR